MSYKLTVFKLGSAKNAEVSASHRQILLDHLEASAGRYGFTVGHHVHEGLPSGDLYRDGKLVGLWGMDEA